MADYTVGSRFTEDDDPIQEYNFERLQEYEGDTGGTSLDDYLTWPQSRYFAIGGFDFLQDRDPYNQEALDFAAQMKYDNEMARDPNYQITLPENKKLGKFSGYELLPKGFFPSFNPSLIKNNPTAGLDYMKNILGGIMKLGLWKDVEDVGKRGQGGNMRLDYIKRF